MVKEEKKSLSLFQIKEHVSPGDEKDVDFVTSSDFVYVSWTGKFISTSAPVNSFSVYIGTRPEGEYNTAKGGICVSFL